MSATVLVVEDDATVAESIRDVLVAAGYAVPHMAASGLRALEISASLRPDLAIMDVELDGPIDGIETARQLRERSGVRVVYLTGIADDDATLQRAKQTNPLGYLKKPFNARELRTAVEFALHQASLEAALAAREEWFATTLQSIGDAVLTTDADDRVTFLNRAAKAMMGIRTSEALGKKVEEVVRLVDARGVVLPLGRPDAWQGATTTPLPRNAWLVTTNLTTTESDVPRPKTVEIEGSIAPIVLEAGKAFGSVMVFRDVSERRQLEKRVGMTERLAAIGTMAAGMQHEINNPLACVVANVQFALDALRSHPEGLPKADVAELVNALVDASDGAERVRRTVEDLRHFSRGADAIEASIEVTTALDQAVKMTAHAVRHHATVKREYGASPRVLAEEGQLARVFMNLLINAAQATGDGGAEHHTIVLTTRTDKRGRAVAEVADDGPGIARDRLDRIFDPFFTTSLESSSQGLGLAVCQSIVTSLGGEIEVESELGKGTIFRVTLPSSDTTPRPQRRPMVSTPPPAGKPIGRGRVLVVDDEIAIGNALRRILNSEHDVTLESDARIALERLSRERYDVVFCDLMMPNMSGMDFYDELCARAPELAERIVFLTGGAFSPRSEEFLRANQNICLAKPFSREAVSSVVSLMLHLPPI